MTAPYDVWVVAREPRTLEVIAQARVFTAATRLEAERFNEDSRPSALGRLHFGPLVLMECPLFNTETRSRYEDA